MGKVDITEGLLPCKRTEDPMFWFQENDCSIHGGYFINDDDSRCDVGTMADRIRELETNIKKLHDNYYGLFQSVVAQYQEDMANHGYSADLVDEWDERCTSIFNSVREVVTRD